MGTFRLILSEIFFTEKTDGCLAARKWFRLGHYSKVELKMARHNIKICILHQVNFFLRFDVLPI